MAINRALEDVSRGHITIFSEGKCGTDGVILIVPLDERHEIEWQRLLVGQGIGRRFLEHDFKGRGPYLGLEFKCETGVTAVRKYDQQRANELPAKTVSHP